jgi:metal-responsive CopG/Arc/MetJ family transcriptional regulator
MRPISLKLSAELEALLDRLSRERRLTRSEVVREALRAYAAETGDTVAAAAGDLAGSLSGPRDLSTSDKHMAGLGE